MEEFKINENTNIVCEHQNTRSGFRHVAILMENGYETDRTKACYSNRTWESYEFQSVLYKLVDKHKHLFKDDKERSEWIENPKPRENPLAMVSAIASLGEIFCDNTKDKNDWKLRMLKAGLENKGLSIPEDWETLSEEEKESRLNKVIEISKEV